MVKLKLLALFSLTLQIYGNADKRNGHSGHDHHMEYATVNYDNNYYNHSDSHMHEQPLIHFLAHKIGLPYTSEVDNNGDEIYTIKLSIFGEIQFNYFLNFTTIKTPIFNGEFIASEYQWNSSQCPNGRFGEFKISNGIAYFQKNVIIGKECVGRFIKNEIDLGRLESRSITLKSKGLSDLYKDLVLEFGESLIYHNETDLPMKMTNSWKFMFNDGVNDGFGQIGSQNIILKMAENELLPYKGVKIVQKTRTIVNENYGMDQVFGFDTSFSIAKMTDESAEIKTKYKIGAQKADINLGNKSDLQNQFLIQGKERFKLKNTHFMYGYFSNLFRNFGLYLNNYENAREMGFSFVNVFSYNLYSINGIDMGNDYEHSGYNYHDYHDRHNMTDYNYGHNMTDYNYVHNMSDYHNGYDGNMNDYYGGDNENMPMRTMMPMGTMPPSNDTDYDDNKPKPYPSNLTEDDITPTKITILNGGIFTSFNDNTPEEHPYEQIIEIKFSGLLNHKITFREKSWPDAMTVFEIVPDKDWFMFSVMGEYIFGLSFDKMVEYSAWSSMTCESMVEGAGFIVWSFFDSIDKLNFESEESIINTVTLITNGDYMINNLFDQFILTIKRNGVQKMVCSKMSKMVKRMGITFNENISMSIDEQYDNFMAKLLGYSISDYEYYSLGYKNAVWSEYCMGLMNSVPTMLKGGISYGFSEGREMIGNGVKIVNQGVKVEREKAEKLFNNKFSFLV